MTKKKTYTPAPQVPTDIQARYQAVLEVLSGTTTVAAAARRLGMSRNHFQTLMHRGLEGMIGGLSPGKAGRPAKPEREVALEAERDRLQRKTEQLEQRLDMTTRLMGLASELIKGSSRPRSRKKSPATEKDDDASEEPTTLRDVARRLDDLEVPRALVARTLGVPESSLRRWTTTEPRPPVKRSTPAAPCVVEAAVRDVRELRGLIGAESLRHRHPCLSRRQAAVLKSETLTAMERERRASCARVVMTVPGVVRGFDAMDRGHRRTPRYVFVAADACVPYRTTITPANVYDDASVARALDADFEQHGAPLVVRMDRAKAHGAPQVRDVLARNGVLVLHGPAHHPCFYGQLERQNRDHSAWVHASDDDAEPIESRLECMRQALNERWPLRSLAWQTPADLWHQRPILDVDRAALRAQVDSFAHNLLRTSSHDKMTDDLAARLAVEHALKNLGYLRIEIRRPLLGDIRTLKQAS